MKTLLQKIKTKKPNQAPKGLSSPKKPFFLQHTATKKHVGSLFNQSSVWDASKTLPCQQFSISKHSYTTCVCKQKKLAFTFMQPKGKLFQTRSSFGNQALFSTHKSPFSSSPINPQASRAQDLLTILTGLNLIYHASEPSQKIPHFSPLPSQHSASSREEKTALHDQDTPSAKSIHLKSNLPDGNSIQNHGFTSQTSDPKQSDSHQSTASQDELSTQEKVSRIESQDPVSIQNQVELKKSPIQNQVEPNRSSPEPTAQNEENFPSSIESYEQKLSSRSQARRVPASSFSRILQYGSLATGLGFGILGEGVRRGLGLSHDHGPKILSESNANRLVNTFSRMRGAALKIAQMISIQDEGVLPAPIAEVFARVRQSADYLPPQMLEDRMAEALGGSWRTHFKDFKSVPIAAASIGQVHKAVLTSGEEVAVKVQYPGVAESIDSDFNSLKNLLSYSGLMPKGAFFERAIEYGKKELKFEVDYKREAQCQKKFQRLLREDPDFVVPQIYDHLSNEIILTSDFVYGASLDQLVKFDQETRNFVSKKILQLCLRELFEFKFMQTDPNWSNFFYNKTTKKIYLLDFGATRSYPDKFIDEYLNIIHSASIKDRQGILEASRKIGFLTGEENELMNTAHCDATMIVGEPFSESGIFDFSNQNVTERVRKLIPIMLKNRIVPPPQEIYSLHRKLSGAFLVCAKLGAQIECKQMFLEILSNYKKAQSQN